MMSAATSTASREGVRLARLASAAHDHRVACDLVKRLAASVAREVGLALVCKRVIAKHTHGLAHCIDPDLALASVRQCLAEDDAA